MFVLYNLCYTISTGGTTMTIDRSKLRYQVLEMLIQTQPDIIDARSIKREHQAATNENIDWHEYSYLLDNWNTMHVLKVTGHTADGMTQYSLNF